MPPDALKEVAHFESFQESTFTCDYKIAHRTNFFLKKTKYLPLLLSES